MKYKILNEKSKMQHAAKTLCVCLCVCTKKIKIKTLEQLLFLCSKDYG